MNLEEMDVRQLHEVRKIVGEAMYPKIDALIEARAMQQGSEPKPKRRGQPNKTEQQYIAELLVRPEVKSVDFEAVKFRLADGAWYTPDCMVTMKDGTVEFHEVKGFWREAARIRIKVVAKDFPQWTFRAVQKKKKKDGGGWKVETFEPSGYHYVQSVKGYP